MINRGDVLRPKVLRILVVDDKVTASQEWSRQVREVFTAFALSEDKEHHLEHIDVVFADTPERGARLWQTETFDLTLIDSHFDKLEASPLDASVFAQSALALNAKYQGLILYDLFSALVNEAAPHGKQPRLKESFAYRADMTPFFIWSSYKPKDLSFPGIKRDILHKKTTLHEVANAIGKAVRRVTKGAWSDSQALERILCFARISRAHGAGKEWLKRFRHWTFILKDSNGTKFPYLESVWTGGASCQWRAGQRLPRGWQPAQDICLPLVGPSLDMPLSQLVGFLAESNPDLRDNKKVKGALSALPRAENVSHSAPKPKYPAKAPASREPVESRPFSFLDHTFPNRYFAAATPLTGITVVGEDNAVNALSEKVLALLNGAFGGVVLKTTYLNEARQWEGVHWPALQCQSHMRSRCLYPNTGTKTLWNTGRTALEMLPPTQLNRLLRQLADRLPDATHRVIVSLGSTFHAPGELKRGYADLLRHEYESIWSSLFEAVFAATDNLYPLVEINARHFLRELVKCYLGGDEYLNPTRLSENIPPDVEAFWTDYSIWLEALHCVACKYMKQLILKMPHRSDSLALIRYAVSLRRLHKLRNTDSNYGVRAITLVNTLKTPAPAAEMGNAPKCSPKWYSDAMSWGDAAEKTGKYQMSGAMVAPYRNQLLNGLLAEPAELGDLGLMISGGIMDKQDVKSIDSLFNSSPMPPVQIGTWGILGGVNYSTATLGSALGWPGSEKSEEQIREHKEPMAIGRDSFMALHSEAIEPRIIFVHDAACKPCGRCRRTHYCDAFLDRTREHLAPLLEPRNCTGCGLCAQLCPEGALQLYRPAELLVLVDDKNERHNLLQSLGVPHLRVGTERDYKAFDWLELDKGLDASVKTVLIAGDLSTAQRRLTQTLEHIYARRVGREPDCTDKFCLRRGKGNLYAETRRSSLRPENKPSVEEVLVKLLQIVWNDEGLRDAYVRAAIWGMLTWTDPGQVLWGSPIVAINTSVVVNGRTRSKVPSDEEDTRKCILEIRNKTIQILNKTVVINWLKDSHGWRMHVAFLLPLHEEAVQNAASSFEYASVTVKSYDGPTEFTLRNVSPNEATAYGVSGFGIGRLAGIDVRGAGSFLMQDYYSFSEDDVLYIAGLPLAQLSKVPAIVGILTGRAHKQCRVGL